MKHSDKRLRDASGKKGKSDAVAYNKIATDFWPECKGQKWFTGNESKVASVEAVAARLPRRANVDKETNGGGHYLIYLDPHGGRSRNFNKYGGWFPCAQWSASGSGNRRLRRRASVIDCPIVGFSLVLLQIPPLIPSSTARNFDVEFDIFEISDKTDGCTVPTTQLPRKQWWWQQQFTGCIVARSEWRWKRQRERWHIPSKDSACPAP